MLRFQADAEKVPGLEDRIRELEDASFLATRKKVRKGHKDHHLDEQLEAIMREVHG